MTLLIIILIIVAVAVGVWYVSKPKGPKKSLPMVQQKAPIAPKPFEAPRPPMPPTLPSPLSPPPSNPPAPPMGEGGTYKI